MSLINVPTDQFELVVGRYRDHLIAWDDEVIEVLSQGRQLTPAVFNEIDQIVRVNLASDIADLLEEWKAASNMPEPDFMEDCVGALDAQLEEGFQEKRSWAARVLAEDEDTVEPEQCYFTDKRTGETTEVSLKEAAKRARLSSDELVYFEEHGQVDTTDYEIALAA